MFLKDKSNFSVTNADKLSTARTINGTSFNGSSDITTANWGTSKTLTIGSSGKSVNGSGNVSWSLSEIGAAASTHTHNYAGSSSAGGAATTALACTGNSATATTLQTARTINGTSFNGSANITTANWGTARNITVGETAKSVNGSGNVSWSLNEIGAAKGKTASATTAATAGWYRIATSVAGMNRCIGEFTIEATVSGKHSATILTAGVNYGVNPFLQQISHTEYSATGISQARIVYHTTYNNNYAYLEVYIPTATATTLNVAMVNAVGWSLVTPSTAGSIPSGYTNKAITFTNGKIVSDIVGNITGSSGSTTGNAATATKLQTARTLALSGHVSGSVNFDGSANATISATLANSGVTAGSYGQSANATASFGGTFTIPQITVDAKGRVTSASSRTITMPASPSSSDTKVTNTLATTTKAYVTGTTSTSTNTGTQVFDTGVYLDTTAGMLTATTFKGALSGNASTATTLQTARTINGTSFNGSGNITTANWGTSRTITIGSTGKSVNGSGNVSWSLSEIGAASASHSHSTLTGVSSIKFGGDGGPVLAHTSSGGVSLSSPSIVLGGGTLMQITSSNLEVQGLSVKAASTFNSSATFNSTTAFGGIATFNNTILGMGNIALANGSLYLGTIPASKTCDYLRMGSNILASDPSTKIMHMIDTGGNPAKLQLASVVLGGKNLSISASAPSSPATGDVWIQI